MTLVNCLFDARPFVSDEAWNESIQALLLMLAPSAPHLTEELWTNVMGLPYSVHRRSWPAWDPALASEDELKIGVSVNGKPRGELLVSAALKDDQEQIQSLALALPRVQPLVEGQAIRRVIYIPGKMLNLVVS
jgi:leucyl-tRNA synthetase